MARSATAAVKAVLGDFAMNNGRGNIQPALALIWLLVSCSTGVDQGGTSGSGGSSNDGGRVGTGGSSGSSGGASSGGGAVGASSGGASSGSSSGGGSSGGGVVFVDASAGSLYDASAPSDADVGQKVTLTADSFTVAAGAEVYKCQTFANPFGKDADLVYFDGTMSQGSHHFFLFNLDPSTNSTQPTPLKDCAKGGLEFYPFPYLSQQSHWIVNYPRPDMGYPLAAKNGLMINVHFLNAGSTPMQASATITVTAAKPGVVTTHIGTIMLNNTFFSVPPTPATSPQPYAKTWTPPSGALPSSYNILTSWSHMHRTSVDFQASANNAVFYEEKNWDSPPLFLHSPALPMSGSTPIKWTCSYYNDTTTTMAFGESAKTNVMCIYIAQYYPVVNPTSPDIIAVLN
jgi:hypothetical protein